MIYVEEPPIIACNLAQAALPTKVGYRQAANHVHAFNPLDRVNGDILQMIWKAHFYKVCSVQPHSGVVFGFSPLLVFGGDLIPVLGLVVFDVLGNLAPPFSDSLSALLLGLGLILLALEAPPNTFAPSNVF